MNFTVSVATFVMACYLWHWQVKVWCLVGTAFQVTGRFCFTAGFNSGSPPEKGLDFLILLPVYILYSTLQVCHELHINVHSIPPVYIITQHFFFIFFFSPRQQQHIFFVACLLNPSALILPSVLHFAYDVKFSSFFFVMFLYRPKFLPLILQLIFCLSSMFLL